MYLLIISLIRNVDSSQDEPKKVSKRDKTNREPTAEESTSTGKQKSS
jgi:hypothetical protein